MSPLNMIYYILIIIGILTRFLPHAPNFTAIGAIALFSGYYIKDKKLAIAIPVIAMLLSDWKLGFYQWQIMASVYISFIIVVLLGLFIKKQKWYVALPTILGGSIIFFIITNGAVWLFGNWYPHSLAGLITCYVEGLPFIKNNLAGDLFYATTFFSVAQLAILFAKKYQTKFWQLLASR